MMLKRLFRSRDRTRPDALYAAAAAQARTPTFYTDLGVDDRIDARFELYTLHVLLLILRLRDEEGARATEGAETAQDLFDVYVSALDHTLRELGVGDVVVGKKMRKLGESLYGRMTAYETPLRAGDAAGLEQAIARNVYEAEVAPGAAALARYTLASRAALGGQTLPEVFKAPAWATVAQ